MGRTLVEEELHGSDYLKTDSTRELLQKTAVAVVRLHQLCTTTNGQQQGLHSNSHTSEHNIVMFHACEVMLSLCDRHWSVSGAASFDLLRQAYDTQKQRLQQMLTDENNLVETGHGDLKPSNIMVVQQQSPTTHTTHSYEIRLIDWDLAGRHFWAFDLAKLFRTERPTAHTVPNRRFVLEAYAAECHRNCLPAAPTTTTRLDPNVLERQVELLLPMAWLEAAIFFVCMSEQSLLSSVNVASRWNQLAVGRLENYHASLLSSR